MRNYLRNLERHHLQRIMKGKMEQAERAVLEMLEKHLEKKENSSVVKIERSVCC